MGNNLPKPNQGEAPPPPSKKERERKRKGEKERERDGAIQLPTPVVASQLGFLMRYPSL